jgi:hypothetical protein
MIVLLLVAWIAHHNSYTSLSKNLGEVEEFLGNRKKLLVAGLLGRLAP